MKASREKNTKAASDSKLQTISAKALDADKRSRAAKEKVRRAKARLKAARKELKVAKHEYKVSKKAAKKAGKQLRHTQKLLQTSLRKFGKANKKALRAIHDADVAPSANGGRPPTKAPKGRTKRRQAKAAVETITPE